MLNIIVHNFFDDSIFALCMKNDKLRNIEIYEINILASSQSPLKNDGYLHPIACVKKEDKNAVSDNIIIDRML
jgi:hypothetical protein